MNAQTLAATGERLHWVWELIGSLPERDRELLTWRYADELSYAEMAARLWARSEELAQALASEHDVVHLPCPLPLGRSDYEADLAHFTPEGRLRYSRWLIAELVKLAEAR